MKAMRTIVTALAAAALLAAGSGLLACKKKETETIKIGAILPLTGEMAKFGRSFRAGIELAVMENNNSPDRTFNYGVIYEDDGGEATKSANAYIKLTTIDKVRFIIGGVMSSTAAPIAPLCERDKVVLISPTATAPKLSEFRNFFFRLQPSDVFEGKVMADFVVDELKIEKTAVLYVNSEWGVGLKNVFEAEFEKAGGETVASESFQPHAKDVRTQIQKIINSEPQAVYILGYLDELLVITRQMEEMGVRSRLLSAYSFYDPVLIEERSRYIEGAIITAPLYDPENAEGITAEFVNRYNKKFGEKPDMFAAHAYDSCLVLSEALRMAGADPLSVSKEIHRIKGFPGVTGDITFDENGDVSKPLRFITVKNGAYVVYKNGHTGE